MSCLQTHTEAGLQFRFKYLESMPTIHILPNRLVRVGTERRMKDEITKQQGFAFNLLLEMKNMAHQVVSVVLFRTYYSAQLTNGADNMDSEQTTFELSIAFWRLLGAHLSFERMFLLQIGIELVRKLENRKR